MLVARYGHRFWLWSVLILFVIVGILLCPQTTWAACGDENPTVLCVDADANPTGTPDGLSWTNAFTNVQDALDVTHTYSATNYEIWVAEGVYRPDEGTGTIADNETMSFTLRYNNVHLYGGFAATETLRTQRDWDTHVTILSGDIDGNDTNHDGNFIAETWNDVQGSNAYHVLWLDGVTNESVTETTVIDGFTITAGQANGSDPHDDGGGLYCAGNGSGHECSPALNNVIFSGNQANVNGGGMYNHGYSNGASSPTLTHVTFSGNRANGNGGGMYNNGYEGASSPALTHVTFNNNWADYYGGGMHNQSPGGTGNSTLTHVTFSGNQANDRGGGLYNDSSCPTLNYVTFDENRAYHGGGMYNDSYYDPSSPTLTHVTFTGNRASGNGGGMRNYSEGSGASSPMLIHVIFSGNQADQGGGMSNRAEGNGISNPRLTNVVLSDNRANKGGGLYNQGIGNACSPALTNVTLSDNRANDGGGMYNYSGSPTLTNVIIWGNMAGASGKQLFNTYQSTPILNYTLIQRGIYDIYNDMESNVIYGDGILTGDPHFAAPNAGNYHLQAISPAIDAGDNAAILTGAFTITTDLDGRDRFVDMPTLDTGNGGAPLVDMGAYEAHTLHVDAEALGDATGLGWTDAFTNVQDALDVTHTYSATNYQIWVAEGVYYPDADGDHTEDDENESFTLSHNNVQLYGGFAATETLRTQRDWEAHLTILSGDLAQDDMDPDGDDVIVRATHIITPNAHHVLWLDSVTHEPITETTVIDGFTITAGHADGGAPDDNGGGLYCIGEGSDQECSPTLSNIAFRGNRAISNGGGMYSEGSLNGVSNPMLINITFSGNRANAGGGMFSFGDSGISSPVLTNVLFSGNQAQDGSGMFNQASSAGISNPALTNVTLGGNQADWRGGGMVNVNSQPALTNVIIWGNTAVSGTQLYNAQAAPVLSYTLIQSGTNGIYNDNDSNVIYGDGILTSDPYFVAPITATVAPTTAGNYRLQAASPAIDAGDNDAIPVSTDLDGNDRFVDMFAPDSGNGTAPLVDLGPYEAAPPLTLRKTVTPTQNVVHHGTVTYTLILSNSSVVSGYPLLLTDTLPISTTFAAWVVSLPGTLRTGNALTWTGTLTAGHTLTWTFTATHIGNYGESVRNTAYVSSTVQRGEAHATFTVERPVLFVDVDAPGSIHDGLSWTTAYTNVQDALDFTNAYSARVYEIWVAEGVYYPDVDGDGDHTDDDENESFTLSYNNVQLYGGFAGTETLRTQRNSEAHLTVLSGDLAQDDTDPNGDGVTVRATHIITPNAHHVLWLDGISHEPITETTVIDGFIITAGDANGSDPNNSGGGLYCAGYGSSSECSPALAHVTFSGNQAIYNRGTHPIGNGGGMFSDGGDGGTSNPTLIHVEFNGNRAVRGGGMNNHGSDDGTSSPTLTHVSFTKKSCHLLRWWDVQLGLQGRQSTDID